MLGSLLLCVGGGGLGAGPCTPGRFPGRANLTPRSSLQTLPSALWDSWSGLCRAP